MRRRGGNVFSSNRMGPLGWFVILVAFTIVGSGVYTVIDNGRIAIRTQRVLVTDLPSRLEGFTILHISDLNGKRFGPRQKQLTEILKKKKYHAVCITGDMVGKGGDMYPFHELLAALDMTKPVFFIAGDADPSATSQQNAEGFLTQSDWVSGAQMRGAVFVDAPSPVRVDNQTIWFTDASQISLDLDTAELAYAASGKVSNAYYTDLISRTRAAREAMEADDVIIALSHNPLTRDTVLSMQGNTNPAIGDFVRSVDLVLAGGTVGGQWRLPFIGPVFAEGFFPSREMVSGYHYAGNLLQYITGGLSTSSHTPLPAFRLFNTPEIGMITLTGNMDDDVLPKN